MQQDAIQQQGIQLVSQMYQLDQNAMPFQIFLSSTGINNYPALEMASPAVVVALAKEIQNHAQANPNAVRVNAFNVFSQNAYQNDNFVQLARYTLVRIYQGFLNNEFPMDNIVEAGNTTVPNMVRFASAWFAMRDPQVMQFVDGSIIQNIQKDAMMWEHQLKIISGNAPFEPFSSQLLNDTLGSFNPGGFAQVNPNTPGYSNMQNSGAFVPGAHSQSTYNSRYVQNGNNAQEPENRYTRELQWRKNMLQGSMQQAMTNAGVKVDSFTQERWDVALQAQNQRRLIKAQQEQGIVDVPATPVNTPVQVQPTPGSGGNMALDIHQMAVAAREAGQRLVDEAKMAAPKPKEFIMQFQGQDGKTYGVYAIARYTDAALFGVVWKPSKIQPLFPAIDPRYQRVAYLELENGQWVAGIDEDKDMTEKLFDYEAHAINPAMGMPEPEVEPQVATPDEPVQYAAPSKQRNINIAYTGKATMELTESAVVGAAVRKASGFERTPEAYLSHAMIAGMVTYDTQDSMMADVEVVCGMVISQSFEAAASMLRTVSNKKLFDIVNGNLTKAVNSWLKYQASLGGISIDSFEEDAPHLIEYIKTELDMESVADALKKSIPQIVLNASKVRHSEPFGDMLSSLYELELSEDRLQRTCVVLDDAAALWVNQADKDMNVFFGNESGCFFSKKHLPWLYALTECTFDALAKAAPMDKFTLVTNDNVHYVISKSFLYSDVNKSFIITKADS